MAEQAPPTPPGVRVRTGRFEKLRSGEFRDAQLVEVGVGHNQVHICATRTPPSSGIAGHSCGHGDAGPSRTKLTEHCRSALPLLEKNGSKPMAQPFVQTAHVARPLSQAEVGLPTWHVVAQVFGDLVKTAATIAPCQAANAFAQLVKSLSSNHQPDLPGRGGP